MVNKLTTAKSSTSIGAKILLDVKTGVVEEKPTKPPGVPKFTRRGPLQTSTGPLTALEGTMEKLSSAGAICQQMLIQGYVQSYVDFYHLTHRIDMSAPPESQSPTTVAISENDLILIRDNLLQAEISRRQGDTGSVYAAYTRLAQHYVSVKDWKTSFFFHEKCLEVAQLTNDLRAEMSANHALGSINQLMQSYDRARLHHERHEQLAESVEVFEEIAKANAELYKVYLILAEKRDSMAMLDEALTLYHLCLQAAKKSWDKAAEAEANGRIGALLLHKGETQASINFLRQQSQLAADLGHAESRCRACTSLALAWDSLGQPDKALSELTLVHTISEQSGDVYLQAEACRALGTMYSKMGKLDLAVEVLQRHFTLLKSILYRNGSKTGPEESTRKVTALDLDLARTYIGISKGNQLLGSYTIALQYDLTSLLDWKLNRSELKVQKTITEEVKTEENTLSTSVNAKEGSTTASSEP